jgi:hypothetical protein
MARVLVIGLLICGALMLLLGMISGGASLLALVERHRHGSGLMFADVEFFGLLALVCCVLGVFSLLVAKRIGRFLQKKEEQGRK